MPRWTAAQTELLLKLAAGTRPVESFRIRGKSASACYSKLKQLSRAAGEEPSDRRCVVWTELEIRSLRQQAANCCYAKDITVAGKTPTAVERMLRELGIHPADWSAEQVAELRRQAASVTSVDQITIPGKCRAQIEVKLGKLNIHPGTRPLTDEEAARLKQLVESGAKPETWSLPGRSTTFLLAEARRRKFRRLRQSKPACARRRSIRPARPPWTHADIALLREQLNRGLAPSEMSIPGRNMVAIQRKAARMGLVGDGIKRGPWSEDERETLRKLVAKGWTARKIFKRKKFPGRSQTSIQKQISRRGWADPERVRRARDARRMNPEELARFERYLLKNGLHFTPEQLMLTWNEKAEPKVTHGRVVYHLQRLNVKPSQHEVRRMSYSRQKASNSQRKRHAEARTEA
jgi:hypothetical protein